MKIIPRILLAALLLLTATGASAQITQTGSDPGRLRWFSFETPAFRLIYPQGLDSLARVYALQLERFREAEARSSGMLPGSLQWGKTPVILHPHNPYSNGMMLWTPKRMDLYTTPPAYGIDPGPWDTQLAVHESRHLAQMQFGYRGGLFRFLTLLTGEIWPGAAVGIYPNMALLEGDAVVAETALTPAGRTRTADFLNYYRVAFDNGDVRDWYRWRYGSFKKFAPDYYTLGYLTVAGMRYFYADTLFTKKYFDSVVSHPLRIGHFPRTVRAASGKSLRKTWAEIAESYQTLWAEEALEREPFMPMERVSRKPRFATDYTNLASLGGRLYATRSGLNQSPDLIRLAPDGEEETLLPFASVSGNLVPDPARKRIYWSETVRDPRWEFGGTSQIRYLEGEDGTIHTLTRKGRLYNPQPDPDSRRIAAVDYPWRGGSALVLLSADDGKELGRYAAPDGLQLAEPAWVGETVYVTGVSAEGFGIYRLDGGAFTPVAGPAILQITNFDAEGSLLHFICDRSGVNELYRFNTEDGTLLQMTASRYGINDPEVQGEMLYYTSMTPEGEAVFRTPVSALAPRKVRFDEVHRYRIEDELTAQEKALADGPVLPEPDPSLLGEAKPYGKLAHLLHVHSWAPLYIDSDGLDNLSLDAVENGAGLGATVFFQNMLGTAYGTAGYHAHLPRKEEDGSRTGWRHSGHLKFTYTGLYPVFELSLDFNDRSVRNYRRESIRYPDRSVQKTTYSTGTAPLLAGSLRTYVPLSFSSGGWLRGVVPQLSWGFSNDRFDTTIWKYTASGESGENPVPDPTTEPAHPVFLQALAASVRGYVMRPTAPSQTYPSLGVGAEAGWSGRPGLTSVFAPAAYAYLYGYLPGLVPEQGLRLSAIGQWSVGGENTLRESRVDVMPRGFELLSGNVLMQKSPWQCRLTADYAVPIYAGDLSFLSPLVYITHFALTPHCDATFFNGGALLSAGASFTVGIANLLWAPFPGRIGVSASYNGGRAYDALKADGYPIDGHLHVGLVFSMDI